MSIDRPTRTVLNVIANIVLIVAIALVARVVVEFFGALAQTGFGSVVIAITDPITPPLGVASPRTPYGGIFDSDAAVAVVVLLLVEWGLSVARWRG